MTFFLSFFFWHTQFSFGTGYLRQNELFPRSKSLFFVSSSLLYFFSSIESVKDVRVVRKKKAKKNKKPGGGGGEEFEYLMIYGF